MYSLYKTSCVIREQVHMCSSSSSDGGKSLKRAQVCWVTQSQSQSFSFFFFCSVIVCVVVVDVDEFSHSVRETLVNSQRHVPRQHFCLSLFLILMHMTVASKQPLLPSCVL